jgi:hypothetical protein
VYKRLFTFGCSFTQWNHPTWAEIVSHDLKIPLENWGIAGLGNVGIFHRILECDIKNRFNEEDLILVLWSSWTREDRFIDTWKAEGNTLNSPFYDKHFVKKYWSYKNDIIKNSTAIISANKMFNIKFQGHILPIDSNEHQMDISPKENELLNFYKPFIDSSSVFRFDFKNSFSKMVDNAGHPDILQHLNFVKTEIYPKLNLIISPETEKYFYKLQKLYIKSKGDIGFKKRFFGFGF